MKSKRTDPFTSDHGIPQEIENKILSLYTDLSIKVDEPDLSCKYLFRILSLLGINRKLWIDLSVREYCIPGTQILDIDVLITRLSRLVILNDHIAIIVKNWLLLLKMLRGNNLFDNQEDDEAIFKYKLTVKDLQNLQQELALSNETNLINMVSITGKTSVNFVDFGIILGKLDQLL